MANLPEPSAWSGPLPEATPPSDMAIYQLPTGTYETRAIFAFRGGSFGDKRHFAATAVLIQHPKGDLLIDSGFGSEVAAHVLAQPRFARAPYETGKTARQQLDASGYSSGRLNGVVLTHAHWDHVSSLGDLQVPIWMNESELEYTRDEEGGKVYRSVSPSHEIHRYPLRGPAYLGFPSSFDVYGDGSIVIALAGPSLPDSHETG